jgi:hypothetical protein
VGVREARDRDAEGRIEECEREPAHEADLPVVESEVLFDRLREDVEDRAS